MATQGKVLILGGGFGGLFTTLELGGHVDVTLVTGGPRFEFKPLLYEYLSREVEEWHIAPKYKELLDEHVNLIENEVEDIDLGSRTASLKNGQNLKYDALVLALGGVTNYAGVQGAEKYALPFRTIADADRLRDRMIDALDSVPPNLPPQDVRSELTFAVVGAGASGVELSTKMADLLNDAFQRRALPGEPRVIIIEMGDRLVPGMGADIRDFVQEALRESRVEVHTLSRVIRVAEHSITIEHDGVQSEIGTAGVVWVGGVRVNPLVEKLDLEKTKHNLIRVRPTLQTLSLRDVFALGDIASFEDADSTLPGTAQLAFQQASLAAENVRAYLAGEELKSRYISEIGEAVSLGTERAAVLTGGKAFGGALARQARFALYTSRLPTWHHRLRVGASWFFGGTAPQPLLPLGLSR